MHNSGDNHRLATFYQYGTAPRVSGDPGGILNDSFGRTDFSRFTRLRTDYSWIQSPTVVHQLLIGVNHHDTGQQQNNFGKGLASSFGLQGMPGGECPWIQLARASSFGVNICTGSPSNVETRLITNWAYSTLWNKGNHINPHFQFGV